MGRPSRRPSQSPSRQPGATHVGAGCGRSVEAAPASKTLPTRAPKPQCTTLTCGPLPHGHRVQTTTSLLGLCRQARVVPLLMSNLTPILTNFIRGPVGHNTRQN
eukprot:812329-Amphidinium_carterae.1